jgi:hypothetical protein
MAPRWSTLKGELVDLLRQRQLGDGHLILDRTRLLLADLGGEQVTDDLLRLVLPVNVSSKARQCDDEDTREPDRGREPAPPPTRSCRISAAISISTKGRVKLIAVKSGSGTRAMA